MKKKFFSVVITILISFGLYSQDKDGSNNWKITIGPPGNTFYEDPNNNTDSTKNIELSTYCKGIVDLIASNYKIRSSQIYKEKYHVIETEKGWDEYVFVFEDDKLIALEYENDSLHLDEEADGIIRDTKTRIDYDKIPDITKQNIKIITNRNNPDSIWLASTINGRRYIVLINDIVFYITLNGKIIAARPIQYGGLKEIEQPNKEFKLSEDEKRINEETQIAQIKESLKPYKEKFNYKKAIQELENHIFYKNKPIRFIVLGDSRSDMEVWNMIIEHISKLDSLPDFIINTGDIVPQGLSSELIEYFIPPLQKTNIPIFVAIGNHDLGFKGNAIEYRYLFGEESLNYYFDYCGFRFIFFDNVSRINSKEERIIWLENTLSNTPKDLSIVVSAHKPIGNIEKWSYHAMDSEYSDIFTSLMTKYNVEHVFFGHIHAYSTTLYNNVEYTISGGAGAGLHDRFGTLGNVHHYIVCDLQTDGTIKQKVVRFNRIKD